MPTSSEGRSHARFHTTLWDVVRAAGDAADPGRDAALDELCRTYWYPLYAFLRRRGERPDDAADLVQGFFASFLARDDLARVVPEGGRFRSYLLVALRHFASDQKDKGRALKRGGGRVHLSLEPAAAEARYSSSGVAAEPADGRTPERLFDRDWALATLTRALERLAAEQSGARATAFERLRGFLDGGAPGDGYAAAARDLDTSTGAVKVAVHRLRRRLGELLRREVADTLPEGGDVEEELRDLFAALGGENAESP